MPGEFARDTLTREDVEREEKSPQQTTSGEKSEIKIKEYLREEKPSSREI